MPTKCKRMFKHAKTKSAELVSARACGTSLNQLLNSSVLEPANQPTRQPASHPASQPPSQSASQPIPDIYEKPA